MEITVKLYATLSEYLPPGAERNVASLTVPEGTTIGRIIADLKLPRELCHLVLVNGTYIPPEQHQETALEAHDVLAIWPPVAGG